MFAHVFVIASVIGLGAAEEPEGQSSSSSFSYNYEHLVRGCVHGNNIRLYQDKSVAECKALCDKTTDCLAFEYGVAYGGNGRYKAKDCQLQSSKNFANCDGGYYNLDLYIKTCSLKNDDLSSSEVNDAVQAFCPDYATDVGVKGKPEYGGSAEMCKQKDQKYETRLHQAMFHGMFGGASSSGRVCKAWCLYDVEEQNRHFRWDNKKGCWKTRKNRPCKDSTNEERGFAADIFDSFCA